jgi:hypothetical protein
MDFQKLEYCNFSKMSSFDSAVIFKQVFGVSNRGQFAKSSVRNFKEFFNMKGRFFIHLGHTVKLTSAKNVIDIMKKVCRATTLHAPFGISNTYNNLQYCGNCRRESCMHVIIKPLEIDNLFYTQIFPILGILDSCLKPYMDFDFLQ